VNEIQKYYPKHPFIFIADSFYGSFDLAKELHKKKLGFLFSCKANSPAFLFTNYLHETTLQKGQWCWTSSTRFSAVTWRDKAKLNLLTNLFIAGKSVSSKSDPSKSMPIAAYYYRAWLGNIDHFDCQLHNYLYSHKHIKWHQALLPALLKIAINNTWIIKKQLQPGITLKKVAVEVIDILENNHTLKKRSRPISIARFDGMNHWMVLSQSSKPCVYCQKQNTRSNTSYICEKCNVFLHPKCSKLYHTN